MVTRILLLLLLLALAPGTARPAQAPVPRVIEITAERFSFWPSAITIADGEEVELRLRSDDTVHGFRILGTGTNLLIPQRGKGYAAVRFTGAGPARFTFECTRICGAGHNFMRGVLIVRSSSPGAVR